MPRHSPSGPRRNRSTSSRPAGKPKPFSKRESGSSSDRFKKSPGKSFRKNTSETPGERRSGPGFKKSFDKPFKKSDQKGPFRKKSTDRFGDKESFKSEAKSSNKFSRKPGMKSERPFRKHDRFESKSHGKKSFDESADKSSHKPGVKKDRPFGKKDRFEDKPKRQRSFREKPEEFAAPAQTEKIRLNKYIANSGVCSRREADQLITMGLISVNGTTVTELGYKVNPGDEVRYEAKVLKAEKPVYVLMNKPKGYLTTTSDPQERNTVMHIVGNAVKERIYPVGRLDRNTTGLLLLTNDGELAEKLMHPSYNIKKIYKVELDKPFTKVDFQKVLEGIPLEEGRAMVDDLAIVSEDGKTVGVELHIGWNRVVRRIFESLEYQVVRLDRTVYAGLTKKDLGRGEWRFLTKEEVVRLKHYQ